LGSWNGVQYSSDNVVCSGVRCILEAEVLSNCRTFGHNRCHIHDTRSRGSSKYKLCSHCGPGSYLGSHLWTDHTRARCGKRDQDSQGGGCTRQITSTLFPCFLFIL